MAGIRRHLAVRIRIHKEDGAAREIPCSGRLRAEEHTTDQLEEAGPGGRKERHGNTAQVQDPGDYGIRVGVPTRPQLVHLRWRRDIRQQAKPTRLAEPTRPRCNAFLRKPASACNGACPRPFRCRRHILYSLAAGHAGVVQEPQRFHPNAAGAHLRTYNSIRSRFQRSAGRTQA